MKTGIKERHLGLDLLKIAATIMVIVLHVNGYLIDTISLASFSSGTSLVWHVFETIAYPAIHLFVMITAWFAIDREFFVKEIVNAWFQTWCICLLGLIYTIFFHYSFGLKELLTVIFPFTGRAYWFVTDYIILMLLSPVLNTVINKFSNKQLFRFTMLLFIIESVFACFLSSFNWNQDYSNIGLFILLYFFTAILKKNINAILKIWGGIIWIVSFSLLFGSYVLMCYLGTNVNPVFMDKGMIFYQYDSPFVIFEAVGLMILFSKINIRNINVFIKRIISILVNASLVVYLVHMHPIIKEHYVSIGVLSWINVNSFGLYMLETTFCVVVILGAGIVLSVPITKMSRLVYYKLESKLDAFYKN